MNVRQAHELSIKIHKKLNEEGVESYPRMRVDITMILMNTEVMNNDGTNMLYRCQED